MAALSRLPCTAKNCNHSSLALGTPMNTADLNQKFDKHFPCQIVMKSMLRADLYRVMYHDWSHGYYVLSQVCSLTRQVGLCLGRRLSSLASCGTCMEKPFKEMKRWMPLTKFNFTYIYNRGLSTSIWNEGLVVFWTIVRPGEDIKRPGGGNPPSYIPGFIMGSEEGHNKQVDAEPEMSWKDPKKQRDWAGFCWVYESHKLAFVLFQKKDGKAATR